MQMYQFNFDNKKYNLCEYNIGIQNYLFFDCTVHFGSTKTEQIKKILNKRVIYLCIFDHKKNSLGQYNSAKKIIN